ncbi:MAG: 4-(cytidine 5'-diphospho)-2-C-methyl-D-erythritol kinase [Steroidobacteraceae bacterium]
MTRVVTGLAPAKVNLFLHILGRRADGYHELQTAFQLVDLCDELRIEATDDGLITREAPEDAALAAVPADQDLVVRAARLLQERSGSPRGARIAVTKRIPMGGGLGGGSSDAACVLRVLNQLWGTGLDEDALAALGLSLGADVPMFVRGRNAWGEGRGERLTPIETPPGWFTIVHPGISIATAAVFADPELTRDTPAQTMQRLDGPGLRNDCEAVVRRRYPVVAEALDLLSRFAPARLSGTGACVFARFEDRAAAERAAGAMPSRWTAHVARGLQRISN